MTCDLLDDLCASLDAYVCDDDYVCHDTYIVVMVFVVRIDRKSVV